MMKSPFQDKTKLCTIEKRKRGRHGKGVRMRWKEHEQKQEEEEKNITFRLFEILTKQPN